MSHNDRKVSVNETESRILFAAEQEFMTKGYAGARTTSIAEAAGVTHAMLHYYFRTKDKLFERILSEKVARLKEVMFCPEDINLPLNEFIRNIINRHLDFVAVNPGLPRFIISEIFGGQSSASYFTDKISEYAPLLISLLQDKIDRAAQEGTCRHVDSRMLILDIMSLNIFAFLASPAVNIMMAPLTVDAATFIAGRKAENYDTIMRKLKP